MLDGDSKADSRFSLQPIKDSVTHLEPVYEQLLRAGASVLETSEPGPDKDALEQKLQDTKDRWTEVERKAQERQGQLEEVVPLAKKYRDETQDLKPWLADAEKALQDIRPESSDLETLEKQLKALKELEEDVAEHKPKFDDLNETTPVLVDSCKADKFVVEGGTQDLNKRYDQLAGDVATCKAKLENIKDAVGKFHEAVEPVNELLDRADKLLESHEPTGVDAAKGKGELDKIADMLQTLKEHEPEVKAVESSGEKAMSEFSDKSPAAALLNQEVQAVEQRYRDALDALTNRKAQLENDVVQAEKFNDALSSLEESLPGLQEAVSAQEPISSDPEVVKEQLEQTEVTRGKSPVFPSRKIHTKACDAHEFIGLLR